MSTTWSIFFCRPSRQVVVGGPTAILLVAPPSHRATRASNQASKKNIGKHDVLSDACARGNADCAPAAGLRNIPNASRTDAAGSVFATRRNRPACASHKPVCAKVRELHAPLAHVR
jgi:hypothetical protein